MYPTFQYNFKTHSFYGDLLPSEDIKQAVLIHTIRCADTLRSLNGSTSGQVVDGLKPTYAVKWINYY
jgi:hypothetical protein